VCGAEPPLHTGTTLQILDCTENTELDSCLKSGFYTLITEFSRHLLFLDTNDCVFFLELVDWLLHLSAGLYEPQSLSVPYSSKLFG